ncbi:AIM24 family protein [Mucilaginibacter pedocola]|uniref:AIM24 family protein n=1 Tax=Mucilaginibacter pedocola TaxID=1792845 RepID=A0A1S9P702_9SPHI|nr:AIM24 family protein [Mucilaginibacter pedocola]OOQ56733.1 hypothetical protein BC343_17225 [Mucilaginibacter pedocola]
MNVKLIGHDYKCLQVELSKQEQFYCERGALIYYEEGIASTLNVLGNGIAGMIKRTLSGESLFMVDLVNNHPLPKKLVLAGKVGLLPVNLKTLPGGIICKAGSYVASSGKVDIDFKFNITSFIGGNGPILQKITGFCTVFLDAIGTPITLDLKPGEVVYIDEKSFIAMGAEMHNQLTPHFSGTNFFGGEGLSMMRVAGPGAVYVSSVNFR